MNITEVTLAIWFAIIVMFVGINRWAKRRGPHWVVDYDPSHPLVHEEEQQM